MIIPVAICTGSVVALFLWLLDVVTKTRFENNWLIFLLPFAGVFIYFLYRYFGKNAARGNNLIIDEIHEPGGGVPRRMASLILLSTCITHLFGGSAGREGTAVQIGGSIAGMFGSWFKPHGGGMRIMLTAGVAGGFGAVFGTPLAGTIFAMEVLAVGRIHYEALLPCLVAAVIGDAVCSAWGIHHTQYQILFTPVSKNSVLYFDWFLLVKVIIAGILFGLAAFAFARISHILKNGFEKYIKPGWMIPVTGGVIIILLTFLLGTTDYLGLGVTSYYRNAVTIVSAFTQGGSQTFSWFWKLLFTIITISAGFKGGEVTPLFFIGATLGNTIAMLSGAPVDLFAALGFIAVFAGATNTPLACTIMGVELFGGTYILYFAIACFTAYFFSGHSGIYSSQRIAIPKH